jgi:hypothetical protein
MTFTHQANRLSVISITKRGYCVVNKALFAREPTSIAITDRKNIDRDSNLLALRRGRRPQNATHRRLALILDDSRR